MSLLTQVQAKNKKPSVVNVKSGDTVKVHQNIKEGNKQRVQVFQGLVIKVSNRNSLTYRILVRRITGGVGVEKSFLVHSPSITKVEITKRSKVRRNYLSYMRARTGKAARLTSVVFDEKNQEIKSETSEALKEEKADTSDVAKSDELVDENPSTDKEHGTADDSSEKISGKKDQADAKTEKTAKKESTPTDK
jgi:large subunit ribosomal protein L19